jgi:hypothetical protein
MSATSFTDTSMFQEPQQNLLLERKLDCIVHDVFHCWSAVAIDSVGIPRITFNGNECMAHCVWENMERYKPYEKVTSDLKLLLFQIFLIGLNWPHLNYQFLKDNQMVEGCIKECQGQMKRLEPVWLRGRGCVSLKTHWANVWLRKKKLFIVHGSLNLLRARRREMKSSNLLLSTRPTCLHCSLNSFFFKKNSGGMKQWSMPPLFAE